MYIIKGEVKLKVNNYYYKVIAQLLDESVDNQHHTDLYYSKRIAESYGETYTDLGNVNKYLRDFAKDVGVELDNKHHTRLWYLKRIADALYDGEMEHNTENYYLRIISENIQPTPPTPTEITFNLKFIYDGSPVTGKIIYDYSKPSPLYTTDANGEIKNLPLPFMNYGEGRYYVGEAIQEVMSFVRSDFSELYFFETDGVIDKMRISYNQSIIDIPTTSFTIVYDMTYRNIHTEIITE